MDYERISAPRAPAPRASDQTLERDVGPELYQQLLAAFLGQFPHQLADLSRAAAVGDVPAARYVAHQLKGSAASFGAGPLDRLADRMLLVGRDETDLLASLVEEFYREVGRFQAIHGAR